MTRSPAASGRVPLARNAVEKDLQVFRFDGKTLRASGSVKVGGGPAAVRLADLPRLEASRR
ncbi:MAG TPA: hypothetical protein VIV57_27395 [Anaeromyxobacter sp.]